MFYLRIYLVTMQWLLYTLSCNDAMTLSTIFCRSYFCSTRPPNRKTVLTKNDYALSKLLQTFEWKLLNPGGIKIAYDLVLFTKQSLNQVYFV